MPDAAMVWPFKVLVVEDEKVSRAMLRRILPRFVQTVEEAEDGLDALRIMESFEPDVVISDLTMPRMDGLTLITRLRESGRTAPVLVFSAHTEPELVERAQRFDVYRFFFKPVNFDLVVEALDELGRERGFSKVPKAAAQ